MCLGLGGGILVLGSVTHYKISKSAVFYGVLRCFEHFRTSVRSSGFEALCSSVALKLCVALKLLYWS